MSLTIATWNIAGARPMRTKDTFDYKEEDIDYFVEKLREVNPDIVCLQETHTSGARSVSKEIAVKLGGYLCYESVMSPSHIDSKYKLGNAILFKTASSKLEHFTFPYPTFPLFLPDGKLAERHDKGFQVAEFSFGAVVNLQMLPLKFLGTPYESNDGKEFASSVENILLQHLKNPLFLCGDFNTKDAVLLYERLLVSFNMKNALPNAPTRPGEKTGDYIFYSDKFTLLNSGIIEANTDHYLCWAKFGIYEIANRSIL